MANKKYRVINSVTKDKQNTEQQEKVYLDQMRVLKPITLNHSKVFKNFNSSEAVVIHGLPGTGKTYTTIGLSLKQVLNKDTHYERLVIVRSIVPTRDIGALPGTEEEKTSVFETPYNDVCAELFYTKNTYNKLKEQGSIKFSNTSYSRSITLKNSIILIDEMQNLTFHELDTMLTRAGTGSKVVFIGDYRQSDLQRKGDKNGILDFLKILRSMKETYDIEFTVEDIVRSPLVKAYIMKKLELGYV